MKVWVCVWVCVCVWVWVHEGEGVVGCVGVGVCYLSRMRKTSVDHIELSSTAWVLGKEAW